MIIVNDRKIHWGNDWSDFDIDNRTIKYLRALAKRHHKHFLTYLHKFLKELYTVEANNKLIILDFGLLGHSVLDGKEHKATFQTSTLEYARENYPDELAICEIKLI